MSNENKEKVLPRGFMIPNVANKEDYAYYKARIFASIPENTALICKNKLNGKYTVEGKGLKYLNPWIESKYVSLASRTIEYPKEQYKTQDGIVVTVDLAMNIRISDPIKYEINTQAPLTELSFLSKELMRIFAANKKVDDLYMIVLNLDNFDPQKRLEEYTEHSGISIDSIYVKNIELPKNIAEKYEGLISAEKSRDAALIEAEERKIRAESAANADKIEGQAKAEVESNKLNILIESLIKAGFSREQIMDYLSKTIFAKEGVSVIANLNGKNSDNDNLSAMQAVAKTIVNSNNTDNKLEKNSNDEQEKNEVKTKKRK